jgi:hypothetical protein
MKKLSKNEMKMVSGGVVIINCCVHYDGFTSCGLDQFRALEWAETFQSFGYDAYAECNGAIQE